MTGMPCITIHQPYASLIMAGVKQWETRPAPPNGNMRPDGVRGLPGVKINRGDRIAIHAAAQKPITGTEAGDWFWEDSAADPECIVRWRGAPEDGLMSTFPAPCGVILGTVEVDFVAQILDGFEIRWVDDPDLGRIIEPEWTCGVVLDRDGSLNGTDDAGLIHLNGDLFNSGSLGDISDQGPYGWWTPGAWAWHLDAPVRFTDPIPAKGRQGVWAWDGTIAEVPQ